MKMKCVIMIGSLVAVSPWAYSMNVPQFVPGIETGKEVESVPLLFGRALLKLVHGNQEEFRTHLEKLALALRNDPNINLDFKCMPCDHKGAMASMRTYYKAKKRSGPSRHAFASLTPEEIEALGKTRFAALEKIFADAGKPL